MISAEEIKELKEELESETDDGERNILRVANDIWNALGESSESGIAFANFMYYFIESIRYTAPEGMSYRWESLGNYLNDHHPDNADVISIFNGPKK